MATGSILPPRHVPLVRPLWGHTGTVFSHHAAVLKTGILRVASAARILWKRLAKGAGDLLNHRARARQRKYAQFTVFERHYDALVDVLCAAAHEGIQQDRESRYRRLRSWMCAHYPAVARNVRAYYEADGDGQGDPFAALFSHECLASAINVETGIEDMMRSRSALEAYRADLEQRSP